MKTMQWILMALVAISLNSWAGPREDQAWQLIDQGALVIDVRTPQEVAAGRLSQAINIPYEEITARFADLRIDKDREVVVYCRSGRRSGIAENALRRAGYTRVFNGGGYSPLMQSKPAS